MSEVTFKNAIFGFEANGEKAEVEFNLESAGAAIGQIWKVFDVSVRCNGDIINFKTSREANKKNAETILKSILEKKTND